MLYIRSHAFYLNSLTNLAIPDGVKEIGWSAFDGNEISSDTKFSPEKTNYYICSNRGIQIFVLTEYPQAVIEVDGETMTETDAITFLYTKKSIVNITVSSGYVLNTYQLEMVSLDSNEDSVIDMLNVICIAQQYNKRLDDSGFVSWYDLKFDNTINLFDLVISARYVSQ